MPVDSAQRWRSTSRNRAMGPNATTSTTKARAKSLHYGASTPTVASGNKSATTASTWKQLRNSVRIQATMDTPERRIVNARIADLCEEDRNKVAKLIERIVELGKMQEESEAMFQLQRDDMEREIQHLRMQAKQDARELEAMGDRLQQTMAHVREYQERMAILEETTDHEAQYRVETDHTIDLLKLEVDRLRALVQKQQAQFEDERIEYRRQVERLTMELQETQARWMLERQERLLAERPDDACVDKEESESESELPVKMKELMDDWKRRMEEAIAETRNMVMENQNATNTTSTGCQTEHYEEEQESKTPVERRDRRFHPPAIPKIKRLDFDAYLAMDSEQEEEEEHEYDEDQLRQRSFRSYADEVEEEEEASRRRHSRRPIVNRSRHRSYERDDNRQRRRPKDPVVCTLDLEAEDDFSDDYEREETKHEEEEARYSHRTSMVLPPMVQGLGLYDRSLFDVVHALETEKPPSPPSQQPPPPRSSTPLHQRPQPTSRVESLKRELAARERRLEQLGRREHDQEHEEEEEDALAILEQVKDVYADDLRQRRVMNAWAPPPPHRDRRSVQEAIERDMQAFLHHDDQNLYE